MPVRLAGVKVISESPVQSGVFYIFSDSVARYFLPDGSELQSLNGKRDREAVEYQHGQSAI